MPFDDEDLAAARFNLLIIVRVVGAIVAICGMGILNRGWTVEPHRPIGAVLFLIGLFVALWLPIILQRRWRSRR